MQHTPHYQTEYSDQQQWSLIPGSKNEGQEFLSNSASCQFGCFNHTRTFSVQEAHPNQIQGTAGQ